MKKRKISLIVFLLIAAIIAVTTIFISTIISEALEREVEKLFPKLAAENSIGDVDFNYVRGIYLENLKMNFLLESGDTCSVIVNKTRLGIDLSQFLFKKGKISISRLKVDTLLISIPMDFDSVDAVELESGFKRTLRTFSRRGFVSSGFFLIANYVQIKDLSLETANFNSIKVRKRGSREFYFSCINGSFKDKWNTSYFKMNLKNFKISSSAVLSNESLIKTIDDSLSFNEAIDNINESSRRLRKKMRSVLDFDFLRASCSTFTVKHKTGLSAGKVNISLAGSDNLLNFGLNSHNVLWNNHKIDSCSFNITADEAGIISRDLKVFTPKESVELSGKLSLKNRDSSNVIFSLKGISLKKLSQYLPSNPMKIKGDAIFNGLFSGKLKDRESWKFSSNTKVHHFNLKFQQKAGGKLLKLDFNADSLILDSASWEDGVLSGGCSVFSNDSIGYNTVFSLDLKDRSLFASRLFSIPIYYGWDKFNITASAFSIKMDSSGSDNNFSLQNLSTEILRVEPQGKRKDYYKRYGKNLKRILKKADSCHVRIGLLSIGKDSLSILEAKTINFKSNDTLSKTLTVSSMNVPEIVNLKDLKTTFTVDRRDKICFDNIKLNRLTLDTIPFRFGKIGINNIHYKLLTHIKKLENFASLKTKIDIKNIKLNLDSLECVSVYRVIANLSNVDTLFSYVNVNSIRLPESMDSELGRRIKRFKTKFKRDQKKLYVEDLKLEADGSRYYSDGYIFLTKFLPCSLYVNLENIKLFKHSREFLKDSTVNVRGGAYSRFKFKGKLLKPKTWKGKGSILLKNLHVSNIPLQKIEIITKYAPTFKNVNFIDIDMNPIDLKPGGQLHIKAVHAKGKELDFTGWGSMDYRGRFYFEMNGTVKAKVVETLPKLTQLALNKGDELNYGKFYAKFYGSKKRQYLVPEKGIHGKVIRSKFREMGASFRNLFK